MEVIPAIDIIGGKCVRLRQGDFNAAHVYDDDPVVAAKKFETAGLRRLHVVDLDGAKAGHPFNLRIIEQIARQTDLILDVGGGLKSGANYSDIFNAGAAMATVGTLAATNRELTCALLRQWGPTRLILGADSRDGFVSVSGWRETTALSTIDYVCNYLCEGFTTVICTDIAKDGMLQGPSLELYEMMIAKASSYGLKINLIASGGVASIEDLDRLNTIGCSGAIIGKALHDNLVDAASLAQWENKQC